MAARALSILVLIRLLNSRLVLDKRWISVELSYLFAEIIVVVYDKLLD